MKDLQFILKSKGIVTFANSLENAVRKHYSRKKFCEVFLRGCGKRFIWFYFFSEEQEDFLSFT